jgi:hypothetical protein
MFLIICSWILLSWLTKTKAEEYQSKFSNEKLSNWVYFDSLEIEQIEKITINKLKENNMLSFKNLSKKNKILITESDTKLIIATKVLNENEEFEIDDINSKIKFGIFNGDLDLYINAQKIDFKNRHIKIIGLLNTNLTSDQLTIKYLK